jgi:hypothetical protein
MGIGAVHTPHRLLLHEFMGAGSMVVLFNAY